MVKKTFARLDAFARGQIVALAGQGMKAPTIRMKVRKKDGKRPTPRAVRDTIDKARANPEWRGENQDGGPGRNKLINDKVQKRIVKLVFKNRGSAIVTIKYIKKHIRSIRKIPRWTVARALHAAGLTGFAAARSAGLLTDTARAEWSTQGGSCDRARPSSDHGFTLMGQRSTWQCEAREETFTNCESHL